MEKKARVHPECINASNPYHECVDYCYRKIVEAKALDAEKLDEDQASAKDPEERTVHPDCINASNPYHECSEFCFRRIAEIKDRTAGDEQGFIEMVRGKEKNTSKKDPAWKYSTQVDVGDGDKTYIYLKCNFYEKIVKGSVTRRKQHLSCSHKNVTPCAKVPEEPREELCLYMKKATVSKHFARQQFDDRVDDGSYYGSGRSAKDFSTLPSTPPHSSRGARGPINQHMANLEDYKNEAVRGASQTAPENARDARRRVCMDIGRFFFENGIPFSAATSSAYFDMIHSVGSYGRRLRPPSMYELRTWILKEELTSTEKTIEEIKRTWPHTGVTLMFDGWSDMKNKSLINILINNPYGTIFLKSFDASDKVKDATYIFDLLDSVIEEIGESLVVQVVTDNGSDYKTAGIKLMEKRKHMYWTPCVAHCIDLILEKFGNLPQHKNALNKAKKISKFIYNHSWVLALMRKFSKNELIRPTVTRFATAYLTLQSILDARKPLEAMFTSKEWLNCAWARKSEGKEVRKIILNSRFWVSVTYAITTTRPLVQVLRMVDTDRKPSMGFIYNSMDEAKKQIAKNLGGEEASYRKIWDIIDEKWEVQFHRHLYAAGYYLNPQFQYAKNKSTNPEIKLSLYHCMDRLIEDPFERARADLQLVTFRNKEQFFGLQQAKYTITKRSPVEWWIQFGDETPDLQRFAMKVLGLTCSSSGCERNWSAYNQIYSKRRNRLSTLRMNSLAYILYNKRLNDRHLKKTVVETGEDPLVCNDVLSDDEWFVDDANEVSPAELQEEDLNVDFFEGGKEKATTSRSTTTQQEITRKGKQHKDSAASSKDASVQSEVTPYQRSYVDHQNDEDDGNHVQNVAEAAYPNLSERQKKLFDLRLKMNEARKANQIAMVAEKKKSEGEFESRGVSKEKWLEDRKKKIGKLLDSNGLDLSKAYMLDTQESAEAKYKKWEKDPAPSGWDVFNQKTLYNAYKKRTKKMEIDMDAYNKAKEADPEFYRDAASLQYGKASKVSEENIDKMVKELADREDKRNSFSRRRKFHEEKDIDSINDRNEHFNKKIERAFGKYTLEIKNNLERGTALPD